MITISFHVKVQIELARHNPLRIETMTKELASEIQSNLESLNTLADAHLKQVSADVTMIGREQS